MWSVPKKLDEDAQEELEELFAKFYRWQVDDCLEGQVEFVDSIYEQFKKKKYLSEKQITAFKNILESCEGRDYRQEDMGWDGYDTGS